LNYGTSFYGTINFYFISKKTPKYAEYKVVKKKELLNKNEVYFYLTENGNEISLTSESKLYVWEDGGFIFFKFCEINLTSGNISGRTKVVPFYE
jgi:hypothetical protein